MKLKFIALLVLLASNALAQKVKKGEFNLGLNYVVAKTSSLGQGSNSGLGVFVGYNKPVSQESRFIWTSRLGINYSPQCQDLFNCNSWWYSENLWLSTGFSTKLKIGKSGSLKYGVGYVIYYGSSITESYAVVENGNVISQTLTANLNATHGPMIDLNYSNQNISEYLSFNYTLGGDLLDRFRTGIHSFGLIYRIPQKGRKYYEE